MRFRPPSGSSHSFRPILSRWSGFASAHGRTCLESTCRGGAGQGSRIHGEGGNRRSIVLRLGFAIVFLWGGSGSGGDAVGADYDEASRLFRVGQYEQAAEIAEQEVRRGVWNPRWPHLLMQCQWTTGQLKQAAETYRDAVERFPTSLPLHQLGLTVLRHHGDLDEVARREAELEKILLFAMQAYMSREDLVAAGRLLVDQGEDARRILQLFYDRVRERDPQFLDAYLATAELAIAKGDDAVAAETLREAQKLDVADPQLSFLLAKALARSDSEASQSALLDALKINPRHAPSLLWQAEQAIAQERYDEAEHALRQVLQTNLHDARAWALMAVLAHLRGNYDQEAVMRAAALSTWPNNPEVDHRIGVQLSRKYRFAEGAAAQRRALQMDPDHRAAKFHLAQDLLRLGEEDAGWEMAEQAGRADPYNVVAYNLLNLRDRTADFVVLSRGGLRIKMEANEAAVYGAEVLWLLDEADRELTKKYGVTQDDPVLVEIFPQQQDFAIRTFGLPGGAGFLGVCFGNVITANSPAALGQNKANWKSVLWHEFAHVVTLRKTRNRMPRWLSEGISVYEEHARHPAWGESMTIRYREMMLGEDLTPVSRLSGAFLNPPTPVHLQFAYYQSSLVVEFLISRHGRDALLAVLDDLAAGLPIDDALTRQVGSLAKLDQQFATYARQRARDFAPAADFARDALPTDQDLDTWEGFVRFHPTHYHGLIGLAERYQSAERWQEAVEVLQRLIYLDAITGQRDGPLAMLARCYRQLGQPSRERQVLADWVGLRSDQFHALERLIEIDVEAERWEDVLRWAELALAVDPLRPAIHWSYVEAASRSGHHHKVVRGLEALAALDPVDPAEIDFRLAEAYAALERRQLAKHHAMAALSRAPRYREAHQLLLKLVDTSETDEE